MLIDGFGSSYVPITLGSDSHTKPWLVEHRSGLVEIFSHFLSWNIFPDLPQDCRVDRILTTGLVVAKAFFVTCPHWPNSRWSPICVLTIRRLRNIFTSTRTFICRHCMTRPQVVDGGDGLRIRRIDANNWISSRGQPSNGGPLAWGLGVGLNSIL
jgi:hypothetical protein